jgi:hypothetical protein
MNHNLIPVNKTGDSSYLNKNKKQYHFVEISYSRNKISAVIISNTKKRKFSNAVDVTFHGISYIRRLLWMVKSC